MFLIVQIPFADFRRIGTSANQRMARPDWSGDNPDGFIRHFGQVRRRHQGSEGLSGERCYAVIDSAIRFREAIHYSQPEWGEHVNINGWYRRLYFDGIVGGRFELGFAVDSSRLSALQQSSFEVEISKLITTWLRASVNIHYYSGQVEETKLGFSGKHLAQAYVTATTSNSGMLATDLGEVFDTAFFVGRPLVYARFSPGESFKKSRSIRPLGDINNASQYLTDIKISNTDINCMIVKSNIDDAFLEDTGERSTRVIFSHLRTLAFSASCISNYHKSNCDKDTLQHAVEAMLRRLKRFGASTNGDDATPGLIAFSEAYEGRLGELIEGIQALSTILNKPSFFKGAMAYLAEFPKIALKTAVEVSMEKALKSGGT